MIINNIEISVPDLSGKENQYLLECIKSNFVSSVGPFVSLFEKAIAEYIHLDSECVTATNSGTSALHLGLIALGVKPSDIVIIPNYTFIATANAVANCGATPWLIDIDSDSLTINTELLRKEIEENTYSRNGYRYHKKLLKRVFCLIPVHIFGYSPDLDKIIEIANYYNLKILNDAAGGLGSLYKGRQLGDSVENGIISFNGNKIITSGGGGIFFSKHINLVSKVKHLASTARVGRKYIHDQLGFNFRISNLHAAVGLAQIERFNMILEEKLSIFKKYFKAFEGDHNFILLSPPPYTISSNWLNVLMIKHSTTFNIDDFIDKLNKKNINIRHFWRPIHMQEIYQNCPKSKVDNSETIHSRVIVLPSSTKINDSEINYTIEEIKKYFKK